MKNRMAVAWVVLALVFLSVGCGGKYSDIIKLNKEFAKLMEAYVTAMEKVAGPKDAAAAINDFADGMEPLVPRMKAVHKKYPEFKGSETLPKEVEQSQQETEAIGRRYAESFMKMMPYMADPEVQVAQMRLSKVMSQMGEE